LFFIISQVTDWLILYVPFTPFIYRGVISEALCIPANLIELLVLGIIGFFSNNANRYRKESGL